MDTSETYIKMRREAKGDLLMGIPIECPCTHIANDVWVDSKGDWYYATEDEVFQLERQGQLQEIVRVDMIGILLDNFHYFVSSRYANTERTTSFLFNSMEQLWLAFVMKENHNKIWKDGWVLSV